MNKYVYGCKTANATISMVLLRFAFFRSTSAGTETILYLMCLNHKEVAILTKTERRKLTRSRITQSRMDTIPNCTIPNGHHCEWAPSRMGTITNGHHHEWAPSRMGTITNRHHLECTPSQMDTIQYRHHFK